MDRLSTNGQMLSQVELQKLPHSSFDMANHNFMSAKLGKLVPTRIDEVYPGDTIKGRLQVVSNFEPLVGPIMASMVTKQECFYVPLNEVWKDADKFFTAKKGFNEPMPSISPRDVFNAYLNVFERGSGIIPDLDALISELVTLRSAAIAVPFVADDFIEQFDIVNTIFLTWTRNLSSFGRQYLVLDLLTPCIDKIKDVIETYGSAGYTASERLRTLVSDIEDASTSETREGLFNLMSQIYIDVFRYIIEYFFGPSSLLDYAGWPVNDNWPEYFSQVLDHISHPESDLHPLPTRIDMCFSAIPLNWLKFRALYLCWYWNYRDQLLEQDAFDPESDEFLSSTITDVEVVLLTLLRVRCWYKDTFTTALTNTGTGNFRVPINGSPISDNSDLEWKYYSGNHPESVLIDTKDAASAFDAGATIASVTIGDVEYQLPMQYLSGAFSGNSGSFLENNSNPSSLSLDLFDRLRRLQSFTQKELLLGYEVDDVIYAHFMVRLSNIRMRIPELLARGREEVKINTIVNNTDVPNGQPAGDKTAVAWSECSTSGISYFAEYWGFFISFYTTLPIQSYTGGLDRSWLKLQRFDYAWPDFATIGMDAVYNAELSAPRGEYAKAGLSDSSALAIFGYQGRYYDLKSKKDETHGRLRTDLNYLTYSREWNSENPPQLNYIFVHCWPRLDMFVTDDPSVDVIKQIDVYHDIDYHRAFPVPSEYLG